MKKEVLLFTMDLSSAVDWMKTIKNKLIIRAAKNTGIIIH